MTGRPVFPLVIHSVHIEETHPAANQVRTGYSACGGRYRIFLDGEGILEIKAGASTQMVVGQFASEAFTPAHSRARRLSANARI
jgi:hypothetical protein